MRLHRSLAFLILAALAGGAGGAEAQETRAGSLLQARTEKQKTLEPYKPSVVETVLKTIESEGILIFRDGFYPKIGSLTTGSGFAWGVGYRSRRLFAGEGHMDVWAGVSMTRYWAIDARLRFPMLADGRVMLEGYARRHEYPQEDYFGLGPASLRRNQSDYNLLANTFGVRGGVRPARIVTVGGGVEYLQPRIGIGTDDTLPPIS